MVSECQPSRLPHPRTIHQNASPVYFTHATHDMPLSRHPLGAKLPFQSDSKSVRVSPDLGPFRALLLPEDGPKVLEDWLYTDRAQLAVHVVSFTDAKIVILTWMHTFLDAISQRKILDAIQAQREEEGKREEEYVHASLSMTPWKLLRFVLSTLIKALLYRTTQPRTIIIPVPIFATLKIRALDDLSTLPPFALTLHTNGPSTPFLSDGNVFCAWWTWHLLASQPRLPSFAPTKTLQIMNVFSMRDVLANTAPPLLRPDTLYIGNWYMSINSFLRLKEFLGMSLGELAARIRADLVRQTTRS
ncbi:hypothetical protein K458DRAFT_449340 [Lentithecium fluviatile CBS 122367]|uniref:Uncharacterized protein n=1 Tax=Lentithecium fluviatile CBS 122367 TaxID=1168545 RepID=A0A6G1J4U8_9PLEO|nr:hypothetical protein K458DRAFT_449340 [Lentithecium fluviatile CBS 122367]